MPSLAQAVWLSVLFATTASLHAQCPHVWLPGDGVPGTSDATTSSVIWDPDGSGPATELVVFGGTFTLAGAIAANRIAAWDPSTGQWSTFGSGMNAGISALAVLPNGDLVAAGSFTMAGGVAANRVARWNGTAWAPLGGGLGNVVNALVVTSNGDLVAGGAFTIAGSAAVARWDGTTWNPMGSGMSGSNPSVVFSLARHANGDVIAGGSFLAAGGVLSSNIARWNGVAWTGLGSGVSGGRVLAIAAMMNGDVIAGGLIADAGGVAVNHVARWNGTAWSAMGTGLADPWQASARSLTVLANGDLIVGGQFATAGGVVTNGIARWSAGIWSAVGAGVSQQSTQAFPGMLGLVSTAIQLPNGDLVIGGNFAGAGTLAASHVARWDGIAWSPLAVGTNHDVNAILRLPDGSLVAGGRFTSIGGAQANRIARWNGTTWLPLGSGISATRVAALANSPNGDIVVGGSFGTAGGIAANNIARWDGSSWSPLGSGVSSEVLCVAVAPNGDVFAGGSFLSAGGATVNGIARWNGASWLPLGSGVGGTVWLGVFTPGPVRSIFVQPNGEVIAGGLFPTAGGIGVNHIARWNGSAWFPMAGGVNGGVFTLASLANGDLIASGVDSIRRWNGASWSPLGTVLPGTAWALLPLPNGQVDAAVTVYSSAGVPTSRITRFDGSNWSSGSGSIDGVVTSLAATAAGELAVGGTFLTVGGQASAKWARFATTCPATAVAYGQGCAGTAGPVALAATTLPWLGTNFVANASGIPSGSLTLGVYGFAQVAIPLSAILPQAGAGCWLLASPDFWSVHLPTMGTVQTDLSLPASIALVGATFVHQAIVFELGPLGNVVAVTSSPGLLQQLGAL